MNEKVAIIIPTYNRAEKAIRAIKSVLNQSYKNLEIWLIDDASTDDTEAKVKALQTTNTKLKYLKLNQNSGVSAARNYGVLEAKKSTSWIALLDSDDEWLPFKLELQMEALRKSKLKFSHTNETWIRNGVEFKQKKIHEKKGGWIYEHCLPHCRISPSTSLFHKDVFDKIGLFREDFIVCEDYDLWLKLSAHFETDFIEKSCILKNGGHEDQLSFQYNSMDIYRLKALMGAIKNLPLNNNQIEETKKIALHKSEILLKGSIKHSNAENIPYALSSFKSLGGDYEVYEQAFHKLNA